MKKILLATIILFTASSAGAQNAQPVIPLTSGAPVSPTNPLPVTGSGSGGSVIIQPLGVTSTPSTAAPTAGAFSSVLASNATRKSCLIQNNSGSAGYVYPGANGSATTANSFIISGTGGTFSCANPDGTVLTDNISATCASGTCAFIVNTN